MARTISAAGRRRVAERRAPARSHAVDPSSDGEHGDQQDHAEHSSQRHPLVHAHHGARSGHQRGQRAAHLARTRTQAAPVETFKVSNDPEFAGKLEAIVGLYLNPPEHALVLCVDEKSQIQALDRTQPGLPLKKGRGQTMTHDYKRNGTATLFAALNTANGEVYRPLPSSGTVIKSG